MVSTIRQTGTIAYNQSVTEDTTQVAPEKQPAVTAAQNSVRDEFAVVDSNSGAPAAAVNASAAPAAPETAAAKPKKQNFISKAWDSGMKALIPLTKKEIKVNVDQTFKLDEAEKYKLDLNVDVDLAVSDKGVTAEQQAFFEKNPGLLLTSKLAVDVKASLTSPCVAVESGTLLGGIDIEVQMPTAIDPKTTPTKQVFSTMWERLMSTTVDLPYTAKCAQKLPQGTVVTSSFVVAGGISLGYADQSAELERRTQVTVSLERGAGGKVQLTITRQRIDEQALDLQTGDLIDHFKAGYERSDKIDRTTVEVFNVDLENPEQMAALQKALPWTGGKYKLIPASDTSKLKELGCQDLEKAQTIKKRDFSDQLSLAVDSDQVDGSVQLSRKYADGQYTIANLSEVKLYQDKEQEKGLSSARSNTLILPDKEAKLSPKQATSQARLLSQCNAAAWRTAPEGTKLTQLVSASLALTTSDSAGVEKAGQSAWQLDPSGSNAITLEITQTASGPTVTVMEQDKASLLAQFKGTNIPADFELCSQIKEFGIYEALADFLQNDGKALKQKYYNSYDTIKEQLATLVGEQLKYNYQLSAGGGLEKSRQMTFGPFILADATQKEAFVGLTGNLDMGAALELGLLTKVENGQKKNGTVAAGLNNYQAGLKASGENNRQVQLDKCGDELVITITDTRVKTTTSTGQANNIFGQDLEEADLDFSTSRTGSSTQVTVYKLDLSQPEHQAAWAAALAKGRGADGELDLDFTEIEQLGVRDATQEKITRNKIYAGSIGAKFEDGPLGTAMQLGHDYKEGQHTISTMMKLDGIAYKSDDEKDDVRAGLTAAAKVTIPDKAAALSNGQVRNMAADLVQFELAAWQQAPQGAKVEVSFGNQIDIKTGGELFTDEVGKAALWQVDPKSEYLSSIEVVQGEKGPMVTLVQTRKADILASYQQTRGSDLTVSDAIASFGVYQALEDYLQNDGAKLKAKYGTSKYAAISEELAQLVEEQKAKNLGLTGNAGRSKALSTTFGPFDLNDPQQQEIFLQAANGKLEPAFKAGLLSSISSKKRTDLGTTVDYQASEGSFKGGWDKNINVAIQRNDDGTTSLVVTETRLRDTASGLKIPDILETVNFKANSKIKGENTQIYVYDLDLAKPEHQAAYSAFLDKINDHKAPEKALQAIADLGVRNADKEQLIKKSDITGELSLDAKESALGSAFTMSRAHDEGHYTFTNLFQFDKNWDELVNLPIGEIGALTGGFNVLGTNKVEVALPDDQGKMTMATASSFSTKLSLFDDGVWAEVPEGTAVTRLATGTLKINAQAAVGKELTFIDGLKAGLKAGITIEPSTNKILGNTVTKTKDGLMVTLWQEDAKAIALGIEAEAKLNVTLSEFGIYNAVTDWLKGGEGLRKKLGTAAYEAADKALSNLINKYLEASLTAKVTSSREHKEKATFGPFDLENAEQKKAFDNLVRFYSPGEALKADLLQSKQVDDSKITAANFKLKLSALEFASQSQWTNTGSDYLVKTADGETLTFSAYRAKYNKSGTNGLHGESYNYSWDTFAVHKTSGDSSELVDMIFQGTFTKSDKRTHVSEAADWQHFCQALDLTVETNSTGKNKLVGGYGKGDGKIQFGCSISGFTETLQDWHSLTARQSYLKTISTFKEVTPPSSEVDRTQFGALPLDTQALRLADDYRRGGKKTKARCEARFKELYPNSKFTMVQLAQASRLMEEYWTSASDSRRQEIKDEYVNLLDLKTSAQADFNIFLASFLIKTYSTVNNRAEQQDLQLYENQYERLTGRDLYQDVLMVESADLFMCRMDEIHADWQKAGGGEAAAALNEVITGITSFGKKVRPWTLDLFNEHEHDMFVSMAAFLNLVGQNNNAIEVSYEGQRFKLAAHGQTAVETKDADAIVAGARKEGQAAIEK